MDSSCPSPKRMSRADSPQIEVKKEMASAKKNASPSAANAHRRDGSTRRYSHRPSCTA